MDLNDSNEVETGHYAGIRTPPRMKTYELRVSGSLDTDEITPSPGCRLMIHGFMASQLVPSALTSSLRATLAFGVNHTNNPSKILASFRTNAKDSIPCACLSGINVIGDVDEVVRLTNITYTVGEVITRSIIYYTVIEG